MSSHNGDTLGDRMKEYEAVEAQRKLTPLLPAMARLDGRAFHTFTRGLKRPYDERFASLMIDTAKWLVSQTHALIGYTQSDEITLVWCVDDLQSQYFFNGRIQKMVSTLAGEASAYFARLVPGRLPEKSSRLPTFDCRVWNVPNKQEAANVFLWREWDATKNSVSMAAQSMFSHKELHEKDSSDMQEMMWQKGVNWNDYPAFFKRGTYVQRKTEERPFTADEIDQLPANHEARKNPNLVVTSTKVVELDMPPLAKVTNRVEVIFDGKDPETGANKGPSGREGVEEGLPVPGGGGRGVVQQVRSTPLPNG